MGIDSKNNHVCLYDLERNTEFLEGIKGMDEEIAKYHKSSKWGYYLKEEIRGSGNPIGLMRSVYKDNGYVISAKNKSITRDDKKLISTEYYFNKKEE